MRSPGSSKEVAPLKTQGQHDGQRASAVAGVRRQCVRQGQRGLWLQVGSGAAMPESDRAWWHWAGSKPEPGCRSHRVSACGPRSRCVRPLGRAHKHFGAAPCDVPTNTWASLQLSQCSGSGKGGDGVQGSRRTLGLGVGSLEAEEERGP